MEEPIKVEVTLKFKIGAHGDYLKLKIKFKSPNKFFKVRETSVLEDWRYERYLDEHHFYTKCLEWFDDEQRVKDCVVNMVQRYFKDKATDIEINRMQKRMSGAKKMEFDVEIKE